MSITRKGISPPRKRQGVRRGQSQAPRGYPSLSENVRPFDGVITARNTDVGNLINSGNGGAAQELFHIAQISKMRVFVNVPEQYSQAARPGLTADLTLAEFPNRRFTGKLTRTSNSIDPGTRTLLVEVDVENPTGELFPGAYAQVHLKLPSGNPVFILPVSALIFQAAGLQVATVDANNKAVIKAGDPRARLWLRSGSSHRHHRRRKGDHQSTRLDRRRRIAAHRYAKTTRKAELGRAVAVTSVNRPSDRMPSRHKAPGSSRGKHPRRNLRVSHGILCAAALWPSAGCMVGPKVYPPSRRSAGNL